MRNCTTRSNYCNNRVAQKSAFGVDDVLCVAMIAAIVVGVIYAA
jgi:hypothetical protein